jgi:hypothetical protein
MGKSKKGMAKHEKWSDGLQYRFTGDNEER